MRNALNDPFGRVSRRRRAAYQAIRAQLLDEGIRNPEQVRVMRQTARRTAIHLCLILIFASATATLFWPDLAGVWCLIGLLLGAWLIASYAQTHTHLSTYLEEIDVTRRKNDDTGDPVPQADDD